MIGRKSLLIRVFQAMHSPFTADGCPFTNEPPAIGVQVFDVPIFLRRLAVLQCDLATRERELARYCNANNMASCYASLDERAIERLLEDELQNLNGLSATAQITLCSGWRFYVADKAA